MTAPVDVLIIGAGASGAAVAWSLAETKMHILSLEQGGWMKPSWFGGPLGVDGGKIRSEHISSEMPRIADVRS